MSLPENGRHGPARATDPPAIIVAAAQEPSHLSSLVGLLQAAGLATENNPTACSEMPRLISHNDIGGFSDLGRWLTEHPEAHAVIMLPLPGNAVAGLLDEGHEPGQALALWLETAEIAMGVIRPHRRRVSLLFAEAALAATNASLDLLAKRLRLIFGTVHVNVDSPEIPDAVLRMMAEWAIQQSDQARNLVAEMHATALPIPASAAVLSPPPAEVFERVLQNRRSLAKAQQKAKAVDELQEENELLLLQLHQVQEELEYYYLQSTQPPAQHWHPTQELEAAHESIRAIYNSYSWKITKPLRWTQFVLSGGRRRASDQAPMPESLSEAKETIRALHNSKSWKWTKPLRVALDRVTGRGRKSA